jgi:hypothetical protein
MTEPQYSDLLGTMIYNHFIIPQHIENMKHPNRFKKQKEKIERQCVRKDCQNMTTHNGGYCCRECCEKDREK